MNSIPKKKHNKRKGSKYSSLHHSIDVSGNYPQKTGFGLFSIKRQWMNRFYKDFRKEFPLYTSRKAKASTLNPNELKKIMMFFDSYGVNMRVGIFDKKSWTSHKRKYSHRKKHFKERIYGLIYCILLKTCSYTNYLYPVTLCKERYLYKPELSMQICKELSAYNRYNFSLSFGDRRVNTELRFADFIAGAALKLDNRFLSNLENLEVIDIKIPRIYYLKTFKHYEK